LYNTTHLCLIDCIKQYYYYKNYISLSHYYHLLGRILSAITINVHSVLYKVPKHIAIHLFIHFTEKLLANSNYT